ncbi:MAG: hypothetical protein QM811_01580 [Pirellulales bacterium]
MCLIIRRVPGGERRRRKRPPCGDARHGDQCGQRPPRTGDYHPERGGDHQDEHDASDPSP